MLIPPTAVKVSVVLSGGIGGVGSALCRRLSSSIEREEKSEVRTSSVLESWDALTNVSVRHRTWHVTHDTDTSTARLLVQPYGYRNKTTRTALRVQK